MTLIAMGIAVALIIWLDHPFLERTDGESRD